MFAHPPYGALAHNGKGITLLGKGEKKLVNENDTARLNLKRQQKVSFLFNIFLTSCCRPWNRNCYIP
jgi:hypothetical protein